MNLQKRLPLVVGILVAAWVLVLLSKASRVVPHSAPTRPRAETPIGNEAPAPAAPFFATYDGRGYLILGMRGRPYIFAGVPPGVWEGFKNAPSLGRYYNQQIRGRYRLDLERR
jgi:hypothetical protein